MKTCLLINKKKGINKLISNTWQVSGRRGRGREGGKDGRGEREWSGRWEGGRGVGY